MQQAGGPLRDPSNKVVRETALLLLKGSLVVSRRQLQAAPVLAKGSNLLQQSPRQLYQPLLEGTAIMQMLEVCLMTS